MKTQNKVSLLLALGACALGTAAIGAESWPAGGRDLANSRFQPSETAISPATAAGLKLRWSVATSGDVTATPAVDTKAVYFPDSAGFLYKVDRKTGAVLWKRPVSDYTGIAGDFARGSPAIVGNTLILGNQSGKLSAPQPARVFAVDTRTGAPLWSTQVDSTVFSFITHSPLIAGNTAYVGIASNEELIAAFVPKAFWQWNFRGSVVALDVATGAIKWQTYTVPQGYYGGAIWGSTGAIDPGSNSLYMATGNNYSLPESVLECLRGGGTPVGCMSPANLFDSIVSFDLTTGAIKWVARGLSYDAWNVGCGLAVPGFVIPPNDNCPDPKGPDWDFAQGPMLLAGGGVGAGQKSGVFWTFAAKTGAPRWTTQAGPGGLTGGLQWGSATDGRRVYVAISNSGPTGSGQEPQPWPLVNGNVTLSGGWAALDVKTGAVLWTTPDPNGSRAEAAVSVANDVVFGCNLDFTKGTMYALNAKTGAPLWSFDSGGPCNAGPSIADGMVFWGSGTFLGTPGPKKVFAFGL